MSSDSEKNMKTDIIKCFNDPRISRFKNEIKGKDIIILFGNTRSGKSTLINYLIGTKLWAFEYTKKNYKLRKVNLSDNGPPIGEGSLSCTGFPLIFKIQGKDEYIVDLPGFEDNRGVVNDIVNSFCFMMIKQAKSVKFAIVFDINELLSDNICGFTKTLEYVQGLITNFKELKFCFIFMKDEADYTPTEIIQLLHQKVLNVNGLNFDNTLVSNVVKNECFVGIFRMPKNCGMQTLELLDVNVKTALDVTAYTDLQKCQIQYSASDKASEVLLETYLCYLDRMYFHNAIDRLTRRLRSYFDIDKYVYASYDEELNETLQLVNEYISEFEKAKSNTETLQQVEMSLQCIFNNILVSDAYSNYVIDFNFIVLMDQSNILNEKNRSTIVQNYKELLNKEQDRLFNLKAKIDSEIKERKIIKFVFTGSIVSDLISLLPIGVGIVKGITTQGGIISLVVGGVLLAGGIGAGVVAYRELFTNRIEEREKQGRSVK